jgi:hypothetical protein
MPTRTRAAPILLLLGLASAPAARATLVVVPFEGTITGAAYSPDPGPIPGRPFTVGESLSGQVEYEYDGVNVPTAAQLRFTTSGGNGDDFRAPNPSFFIFTVRDNSPGTGDLIGLAFQDHDAIFPTGAIISLTDPTGTALDSAAVPTAIDPARFARFRLNYEDITPWYSRSLTADLHAISVPEPPALGLALAGLMTAAGWAAGRSHHPFRLRPAGRSPVSSSGAASERSAAAGVVTDSSGASSEVVTLATWGGVGGRLFKRSALRRARSAS